MAWGEAMKARVTIEYEPARLGRPLQIEDRNDASFQVTERSRRQLVTFDVV